MASVQKLMFMSCYGITRKEIDLSLGMENETKTRPEIWNDAVKLNLAM